MTSVQEKKLFGPFKCVFVFWVNKDHFNNLALVVLEGIARGCAGGEQMDKNLRYHDGDGHGNIA